MEKLVENNTSNNFSEKGTKILAKTFFKQLKENGFSLNQILSISTELIGLISTNIRTKKNGRF